MNMTNDEFERRMAFIVEQQAQFASDIHLLQESQARTEKVVAHTAEFVAHTAEFVAHSTESVAQTAGTVAQMGDVVTRLANVTHVGFTEVNAKMNALIDAQIRTEVNLTNTNKNLDRTDENLRNLIAAVDRLSRDRKNGK